jgi:hypothetical protein
MESFKNFFGKIDLFAPKIQLFYKGENKLKTKIGGIFTLISSIVLIILIYYFGKDLIEKANPRVNVVKIFNENSII